MAVPRVRAGHPRLLGPQAGRPSDRRRSRRPSRRVIVLRNLVDADAPAVRRIYSGAAVSFLGRPEMTAREAEEYVRRVRQWAAADPVEQYILGVEHAGDLVGVVKLGRRPGGHGRVSYVLREDSWGRGHATQAVRELVAFAFTAGGFDSLGAKHHPGNPASGRVLAKAGFTRLGTRNGMVEYRIPAPAGPGG
ncbi:GNAT family N-acetyltransferase [Streptomyces sp. OfavH-34-F]|uniref:GNAT family N-acetyltransferase n=1 Tax=Streptomyces sp. OfavH-34-F TaxID=2917760 RepID=UPI001EF223D6|nr:GNAT family N-acetyltransferase [Streptomyces sp. OfavH-34-F]MCG7523552.1 GNAT family N-acetyltransferase [Streptomyces sp. OfavH-34-F]